MYNMIRLLKTTKWYWWIPLFGLVYLQRISGWIADAENVYDAHDRWNLVFWLHIPIQLLSIVALLKLFNQ
jgi:hypothetical protein